MADQLKDYGCDDVKVEPFDLHPAAFMGWIYITVSLVLAAFVLFFVPHIAARIVALVLVAVGAVVMLGEFIMYRKVVDKIYPKMTSCNVTAVKNRRAKSNSVFSTTVTPTPLANGRLIILAAVFCSART